MKTDLNGILACPECGGGLNEAAGDITCAACGKKYMTADDGGRKVPVLLPSWSNVVFSPTAGQYGVEAKNALLSKLAAKVWPPEPLRFYGDMQRRTGIKNLHKALADVLEQARRKPGAVILDVGCGRRRLGADVVNLDVFVSRDVDVISDGSALPVREGCADLVVIQTVLEHVPSYDRVVRSAARALKNDGVLFLEVPFYYPYHGGADFVRFTPDMVRELLCSAGMEIRVTKVSAGPFSALALSVGHILPALLSFGVKRLYTFWFIVFGWMIFWLKYLDILYPAHPMLWNTAPVFYVIAGKGKGAGS